MLKNKLSENLKQIKSVQKAVQSCTEDEYTIGYYNGLEYVLSLFEKREPNYKMYENKGGEKHENIEKPRTRSGYIKKGV